MRITHRTILIILLAAVLAAGVAMLVRGPGFSHHIFNHPVTLFDVMIVIVLLSSVLAAFALLLVPETGDPIKN
jgi:hypothetical protein